MRFHLSLLAGCIAAVLLVSSCGSVQKYTYFRGNKVADSVPIAVDQAQRAPEAVLQPGDIVAINVTSRSSIRTQDDPVSIFREGGIAYAVSANVSMGQSALANNPSRMGYLLDTDGNIDYPLVGKINIGGLTTNQAKVVLADKLKAYVNDPTVEVRILNFKVVVMGEVGVPGTVIAPSQSMSIVDAIAAAGDIMITGDKQRVLLVRNEQGTNKYVTIDMTSRDIFKSPYFYLKQGDIVVVSPNRVRRQQNSEFTRTYLPTIATLLSSALTAYTLLKVTNNLK